MAAVKWTTLSREDLGHLYSPSCWSKKLAADVVVNNHVRAIVYATGKAKGQVKHRLDVPYGEKSSADAVDIYYPDQGSPGSSAVLMFIHGGYWCYLGKEHYGYISLPLTKQGITTVIVDFDNAPKGTMTTIVDQCRRACVYIAKTFPEKRLYVCGYSAGAHLCACLLSTDWKQYGMEMLRFSGAILISGLYDLNPIQRCYVNDPLNLTESEVCEFSPQNILSNVRDNVLPSFSCLLTHGEQESPEFKRQQEEYHQGLLSEGVASSSDEVIDEDHFSVVERIVEDEYSLTRRIIEMIKQDAM